MVCEGLPNLGELALLDGEIAYRFERIDADGDGHWDYRGTSGVVSARELFLIGSHVYQLRPMPREDAPLSIEASNAPDLMGGSASSMPVPADGGLEILFTAPHPGATIPTGTEVVIRFDQSFRWGSPSSPLQTQELRATLTAIAP